MGYIIVIEQSELERLLAAMEDRIVARLAACSTQQSQPSVVRGLDGIAAALHISRSTAARLKREGKLDGAIWQEGRVVTMDVQAAKHLLKNIN